MRFRRPTFFWWRIPKNRRAGETIRKSLFPSSHPRSKNWWNLSTPDGKRPYVFLLPFDFSLSPSPFSLTSSFSGTTPPSPVNLILNVIANESHSWIASYPKESKWEVFVQRGGVGFFTKLQTLIWTLLSDNLVILVEWMVFWPGGKHFPIWSNRVFWRAPQSEICTTWWPRFHSLQSTILKSNIFNPVFCLIFNVRGEKSCHDSALP